MITFALQWKWLSLSTWETARIYLIGAGASLFAIGVVWPLATPKHTTLTRILLGVLTTAVLMAALNALRLQRAIP